MPDSQSNQQSDPDIDRITEKYASEWDSHSGAIRSALLEYKSLLDQKHAPSKDIEERIREIEQRHTKSRGSYVTTHYKAAFKELAELATELNKEREDLYRIFEEKRLRDIKSDSIVASCNCLTKTNEVEHHAPGCKYRIIMERDSLKQQLAEAERMRDNVLSDRNAIIAQGIAQSAMVEKLRRKLVQLKECDIDTFTASIIDVALALQPDQSLYYRCCNLLKEAADDLENEGGYHTITNEIYQLLADLGQPNNPHHQD